MAKDNDTLGNRMKTYEALSTSRMLMPNIPVYARIDGRAFHTFCRGLLKPYSSEFIDCMKAVARNLVDDFGAVLGYVESDEISLGWTDYGKAPFEGRIQKLESVLASASSAYMNREIFGTELYPALKAKAVKNVPTFDCRCFNVPSVTELANAFLWRENDAIKNSCMGMALNFYSTRQLDKKNTDDKIRMMAEKGYNFYGDTDRSFLRGTFFQRDVYLKELTDTEIMKIPEKNRPIPGTDGKVRVVRSEVREMSIPYRLTDIANVAGVLFEKQTAVKNKTDVTFDFSCAE